MYFYFGVRVLDAILYPVAVGFLKITIQRIRLKTQLPWTNDQSPSFLLICFNCVFAEFHKRLRAWVGTVWLIHIYALPIFVACIAVGVTDPKKIPDSRMTASTVYSSGYQPYYGRVNTTRGTRWCPKTTSDRTDYLQVDMGAVHTVCEVATQTLNTGEYTKTYYVRVSVDGVTWNKTYQENKAEKVNYNLVLPSPSHKLT